MNAMIETAKQLTAAQIKAELAKHITNDDIDQIIIDALMAALESKISESEFVAFCGELEEYL